MRDTPNLKILVSAISLGMPNNVTRSIRGVLRTHSSIYDEVFLSPGRQIGMLPGWSNGIFSGRPGEVGGRHPRDVLGTNIWWLGLYL